MPIDINKVRKVANLEKVRRVLVHYFLGKCGKQGIDRIIDPACLIDLTMQIPPLHTKVEIVPNARNMKLMEDQITIEWNLFVLGNQQQYLGRSTHQNIMQTVHRLKNGAGGMNEHSIEYGTTPRRIIAFILRVLEKSEDGYVPWIVPSRNLDSVLNFGLLDVGHSHNSGVPSDVFR